MFNRKMFSLSSLSLLFLGAIHLPAHAETDCRNHCSSPISFIEYQVPNIALPGSVLTIKGKLKLPACNNHEPCSAFNKNLPAVVILHGSSGVDFRGDFYARALNKVGIATLEINMWEARGVELPSQRPRLPLFTYADGFGALRFLAEHPAIDPNRIGAIGFSWGGVMTMASATKRYTNQFGGGLQFAALVANYPICYAYNIGIPGGEFNSLTSAPLLIQIGSKDDYDDGAQACFSLVNSLTPSEQENVQVVGYEGAHHAWDRLEVPITVTDPFAHHLAGGAVDIIPDPVQADASLRRVTQFFRSKL